MKIETVKISAVKSNPQNPRIIKDDKFKKLVTSIKEFPQMLDIRPIVVNDEMIVLGGNMRLKACIEAGLKEVAIIKASELTPEQQNEFIIKDNVGFGEWNWDDLANSWDTEQLTEWGLDIPNFEVTNLEAEEDDFETPEGGIETDIVLGDLFEIGEHRLLCGDSTDSEQVSKLMNGCKADLMITDPPYGMDKKEIKNDSFEFYPTIVKSVMESFLLFTKDNSSAYCFGLYPYFVEMHLQIKQYAFSYIQDLYWLKGTTRSVNNKYRQIIENIIYFSKNDDYIFNFYEKNYQKFEYYLGEMSLDLYKNPNKATDKNKKLYSEGLISMPNLLQYTNCKGFLKGKDNVEHPTMKPIEMLQDFILQSSKENDLILDLFLGSGSTMVASHQLKRKCYGMELDPKYCQVIIDRMKKLDPTLIIKRNGIRQD